MLTEGKDPETGDGYAFDTANGRAYRLDQFYRWVWEQEGRYTTTITHDHGDGWLQKLAYGDTSQENKASHLKALKMLFRWRASAFGDDEWEPQLSFSTAAGSTQPKDFLTREERQAVQDTALEFGSVPSYTSLSPTERDRWKAHLAQRFEKPKPEIGRAEFEQANSWKIPSLMWTTLDAGLRPVEVKRATVGWVDINSKVLRIPRADSSKNSDNWVVSIFDRTANALSRWLTEREVLDKYDGTDTLWLNRSGNPYQYYSLNRIFRDICREAGIPAEGRTFYAIRHSVGTYMARGGSRSSPGPAPPSKPTDDDAIGSGADRGPSGRTRPHGVIADGADRRGDGVRLGIGGRGGLVPSHLRSRRPASVRRRVRSPIPTRDRRILRGSVRRVHGIVGIGRVREGDSGYLWIISSREEAHAFRSLIDEYIEQEGSPFVAASKYRSFRLWSDALELLQPDRRLGYALSPVVPDGPLWD